MAGQPPSECTSAPGATKYDKELARIVTEYQRRGATHAIVRRYRPGQADVRMSEEGIQRALQKTFARCGIGSLVGKRVLDVGCGSGGWLARMAERYGAEPVRCVGVDLMEDRIAAARASLPEMEWHVGSAHALPLASASCDVILCFTVFSSILDDALSAAIAGEMWRVLAPSGVILWYDFMVNNPANRAVRGVPLARIRSFFGESMLRDVQRITLAPPLARRLAPRAPWLARALERGNLLNTHLLVTLQKGGSA